MPGDRYEDYYAAKLWQMVPGVYRALDSDPVAPGPLKEIVDRVGAQAAVVRRSLDRLWEDQSIESCDDWIIPYIGDLLATRIVACLDARAQRLDVANTIYYRRRKGTVGLLEEMASDIAGRDARVVEFFRRLGRARHNFDPPIGMVPVASLADPASDALQVSTAQPLAPPPFPIIEGLSGVYTHTPMGGTADLRHRYGASRTGGAFDEYAHTADFRRGRQSVGWHGIPRLGVFVWWLLTYQAPPTTPVRYTDCADQYTFDPTGREVPLFAALRRKPDSFGEAWVSPDEWQLPGPIDQMLFDLRPDRLYPDPAHPDTQIDAALAVVGGAAPNYFPFGLDQVAINVARGRFRRTAAPAGSAFHVRYHYGFASDIGAGPYDRLRGRPKIADPIVSVSGGDPALTTAVAALGGTGTLSVGDSLTYPLPGDLGAVVDAALLGKNEERPVIRAVSASRPAWTITGSSDASRLVLEGFHLVGADLVLAGSFASVTIRCATLDPGTSGAALTPPALYAPAADNQPLWPTRLFVEGSVTDLYIERAITGPIRTRGAGLIETLHVTDSIVQAIPGNSGKIFAPGDFYDPAMLVARLKAPFDPVTKFIAGKLPVALHKEILHAAQPPNPALVDKLRGALNTLLGAPIYSPALFANVNLSAATRVQIGKPMTTAQLIAFNRALLADAFPLEFADLAIATAQGKAVLSRSTILGPCAVHRLDASECILDDVVIAEDAQHGCVRFSAYAEGSLVHQPYESVTVAPAAPLFMSRDFGNPDYARLRDVADDAILSGRAGASILEGAQNGAEMGAFCREAIALKRRGLDQKFIEYMPVGLVPVWIDAT